MGPFQITSCSTFSVFTRVYLQQEHNTKLEVASRCKSYEPTKSCSLLPGLCRGGFWKLNPHAILFSHGTSYSTLLVFFQKQPKARSENKLFLTFSKQITSNFLRCPWTLQFSTGKIWTDSMATTTDWHINVIAVMWINKNRPSKHEGRQKARSRWLLEPQAGGVTNWKGKMSKRWGSRLRRSLR